MPFSKYKQHICKKHWVFLILASLLLTACDPFRPILKKNQKEPTSKAHKRTSVNIQFPVTKYKLDNGLTVLLHQDSHAPLVNYQTWFRVGSRDDPPQRTGMAHLFEHLMFRGTHKREGKDFVKDIESRGISFNAYTSFDKTVYYFNLPLKELDFIAELEAERMHDLALTPQNLKLEQEIVKEERLMRYKNNPQNLWTDIFELAFNTNHYRWPVIGYPKDIEQTTAENCQNFYKKFYAPNNAVIVIAGPIQIKSTQKILEKHYGSLPSSSLTPPVYPKEPPQTATRMKTLHRKVQTPSLAMAYSAPKAGLKEAYALDILSFILGGSKSSRLYQILVEQTEQAISTKTINASFEHQGLFIIFNSLHPQKKIKPVHDTILKEIQKLTHTLVTSEELERARTNLVKAHVDALKTAEGKANLLAIHETLFNDYSHLFEELERYHQVSTQDILNTAQKFLQPKKMSWIQLLPKK